MFWQAGLTSSAADISIVDLSNHTADWLFKIENVQLLILWWRAFFEHTNEVVTGSVDYKYRWLCLYRLMSPHSDRTFLN